MLCYSIAAGEITEADHAASSGPPKCFADAIRGATFTDDNGAVCRYTVRETSLDPTGKISEADHAAGDGPAEGRAIGTICGGTRADNDRAICRYTVGDALEDPAGKVAEADHTIGAGPAEGFDPVGDVAPADNDGAVCRYP